MVGTTIRELRKKLGLTQEQLAGQQLTKSYVSQVELGRINPSPKALQIIASRLGKPVGYFVENRDDLRTIAFLLKASQALWSSGRLEEAALGLSEALSLAERTGREDWMARIKLAIGQLEIAKGNYRIAQEYLEESLTLSNPHDAPAQSVEIATHLGVVACRLGSFHQAMNSFQLAMGYTQHLGDEEATVRADAARQYGDFCHHLGQWTSALDLYHRALGENPAELPEDYVADIYSRIADALAHLGRSAECREAMARSEQYLAAVTNGAQRAAIEANLAYVLITEGTFVKAYEGLRNAYQMFRHIADDRGQVSTLSGLIHLCTVHPQNDWIRDVHELIGMQPDSPDTARLKTQVCLLLVRLAGEQQDWDEARQYLREATQWSPPELQPQVTLVTQFIRVLEGQHHQSNPIWLALLEPPRSPCPSHAFTALPQKPLLEGLPLAIH